MQNPKDSKSHQVAAWLLNTMQLKTRVAISHAKLKINV